MDEFKKLEIEKVIEYKDLIYKNNRELCDNSLGVIYGYNDYFNFLYSVDEKRNIFYLKGEYDSKKYSYYLPFLDNMNDLDYSLKYIENMSLLEKEKPLTFCCVRNSLLPYLTSRYPNNEVYYERDWSDYLYFLKDLKDFKGNKYSSKRHQKNNFIKLYPHIIFKKVENNEINEELILRIEDFVIYFESKKNLSKIGELEENATLKLIYKIKDFNLDLFLLLDENKIVGVSVIEKVNNVVIEHIEKCNRMEYKGIYPYFIHKITSYYAEKYSNETLYLNREDDSGDEGLRYSKIELHPIELVHKYVFKVMNNLNFLDSIPEIIINEDYMIKNLETKDKERYKKLVDDKEINKYFYLVDEVVPSFDSHTLYSNLINSLKKKESYSFFIYKKNKENNGSNSLVGEIILWNLTNDNKCEIGIRIFNEYTGKNIAYLALISLFSYIKKNFNLKKIKIRYYKENSRSEKLFSRFNIEFIKEDKIYKYYELSL